MGEDVVTYRLFEGELTLVEEVTGQFLIKNTDQAAVEGVDDAAADEDQDGEGDSSGLRANTFKSRKVF